jgi:hypothetical protein
MRSSITALCLAASLGATALAGCGSSEESEPFDVAKAAAATAGKGTARMTVKVSLSGAGLPIPIDVDAKGVTSLDSPEGKLVFDLAPLLSLAGAPQGTPGDLEVRFRGGTLYAKPPKIEQLQIPGGKAWVSLELPKVAEAFDIPSRGLGKLFTLEPAAQLRALQSAKGLKKVGEEDVAGAETTHYRGTYRLADLVKTLSPAEQADIRKAVAKLDELDPGSGGELLDQPTPADLWVDEDGVTRKMLSTAKVPAQGGQPAGTIKQSYVLSDFGTPLDASPPAAGDTYAATDAIVGVLGTLGDEAATATP